MDATKLKYPYGKCKSCGGIFNADLRYEHNIIHCPWCGDEIDDFLSPKNEERESDIYCEECGVRIYERDGEGGHWINNKDKYPGVCSGPCERELCGNCGDWDEEGCCPKCHKPDNPDACCDGCPKDNCDEIPETCKNPCPACPMESDCCNDNTDKRSDCVAFSKFQKETASVVDAENK